MISFWKRAHRPLFPEGYHQPGWIKTSGIFYVYGAHRPLFPEGYHQSGWIKISGIFYVYGLIAQRFQKVIIWLSINKNREFFILFRTTKQHAFNSIWCYYGDDVSTFHLDVSEHCKGSEQHRSSRCSYKGLHTKKRSIRRRIQLLYVWWRTEDSTGTVKRAGYHWDSDTFEIRLP